MGAMVSRYMTKVLLSLSCQNHKSGELAKSVYELPLAATDSGTLIRCRSARGSRSIDGDASFLLTCCLVGSGLSVAQ